MKKGLLVVMAALALVLASSAFAAPKVLSSAQLDSISAGAGLISALTGIDFGLENELDNNTDPAEVEVEDNLVVGAAARDEGVATNGDFNTYVEVELTGNVALGGEVAVAGDGNKTITIDDIEDVDGDGAFVIVGDENDICVDNSETKTFTDSFNEKRIEFDIDVNIDDSFNVTTNTIDVTGQTNLNAVINAVTNGYALNGANLQVTNATASVPTMQGDSSLSVPIIAGNAIAFADVTQVVVNASIVTDTTEFD